MLCSCDALKAKVNATGSGQPCCFTCVIASGDCLTSVIEQRAQNESALNMLQSGNQPPMYTVSINCLSTGSLLKIQFSNQAQYQSAQFNVPLPNARQAQLNGQQLLKEVKMEVNKQTGA